MYILYTSQIPDGIKEIECITYTKSIGNNYTKCKYEN